MWNSVFFRASGSAIRSTTERSSAFQVRDGDSSAGESPHPVELYHRERTMISLKILYFKFVFSSFTHFHKSGALQRCTFECFFATRGQAVEYPNAEAKQDAERGRKNKGNSRNVG